MWYDNLLILQGKIAHEVLQQVGIETLEQMCAGKLFAGAKAMSIAIDPDKILVHIWSASDQQFDFRYRPLNDVRLHHWMAFAPVEGEE